MIYCSNCGNKCEDEDKYCSKCGNKLKEKSPEKQNTEEYNPDVDNTIEDTEWKAEY